jgi:phage-related protein
MNTDRIVFYIDNRGDAPVYDYIASLAKRRSKDSRIKYNKINEYILVLCELGMSAGEPFIKHIEGAIWELRPLSDRIFFAAWDGNRFILLHHFMKKTKKTPLREIETAKRRLTEARKEPETYER